MSEPAGTNILDTLLDGLGELLSNNGSRLTDLRYQLKVLNEERAGLYTFAHLKEGDLTALARGYYGEHTQGAYAQDQTLITGATGIIRELRWRPPRADRDGYFYAMWEPTLKWGRYSNSSTPYLGNNTYVRSVGSQYFVQLDRLTSASEPYPWVLACRTCGWEGPVPEPTPDTPHLDCPNCEGHYQTGAGNYGTRLYVVNPRDEPDHD